MLRHYHQAVTPAELSNAIVDAARRAVEAGDLTVAVPDAVSVERPKNRAHGDYATNVALRLAKPANRPSREVAEVIAAQLRGQDGITAVDVAGPGFLNVTLAADALGQLVRTILSAGQAYGRGSALAGQRLNLEFVSANPTGPLHIGSARWAAVGDSLARLMVATGAAVATEYYFNDAGAQIDRFARSLYAVATGEPVPEDGYSGEYIGDVARAVVAAKPEVLDLAEDKAVEVFRADGIELMFDRIKAALARFGVQFDLYFNERDLHTHGELEAALTRLREQGNLYEADGALWLRSTDFGDDKDRPLIRSNGWPTYFAADAAYYLNKRKRGFDKVIIVLGADHHGYIGRLRAMVACFGDDPDRTLEIPIGQMVTLRGGKMSKRAGNLVTMDDLVEAIGVDAARYALVRWSMDSTIDLDLDLWSSRTNDNPVFYVQYAHARLASLQRNAVDLGIPPVDPAAVDYSLLVAEQEGVLLRALGEFPRVVAAAAELRAPHRVARYLEELAGTYHRFYDSCRVLPMGDEPATPLSTARLALSEATRIVLANGLGLLGVSAPDRM